MTVGEQESRQLGHADLSAGEEMLSLSSIPVWAEAGITDGYPLSAGGNTTILAAFHPPCCGCGRAYGIAYDQKAIALDRRWTMNVVLLHELVHAWQYWLDPAAWAGLEQRPDAPHEVEARELADRMDAAGVCVWFR